MEEKLEVPIAKAFYGFKRVVVSDCPYCHKEHVHSSQSNSGEKKTAECFMGEYILEIQ